MQQPFIIERDASKLWIRVFGNTIEQLFAHAVVALDAVGHPSTHSDHSGAKVTVPITLHAENIATLFVNFCNEVFDIQMQSGARFVSSIIHEASHSHVSADLHGLSDSSARPYTALFEGASVVDHPAGYWEARTQIIQKDSHE